MTEVEEVRNLIQSIKEQTGIDVRVKNRVLECVSYRQCAMVYVMNETALTLQAVGDLFERDHATIIHAVKSHTNHLANDGNKGDVYRTCWGNLKQILDGKLLNKDFENEPLEDISMNVALRKKIRVLKKRVNTYAENNSALIKENAILRRENKSLKNELDSDPNRRFDNGPMVEPVEHNWQKTYVKKPDDNFTVGNIKYF